MASIEELKKEADDLRAELLGIIARSQANIKEAQDTNNEVKVVKEEAKSTSKDVEDIMTKIILIRYLLGYKKVDKKASSLPTEHKDIAETYAEEITQTYNTRMSQLIQSAIAYKATKRALQLLKKIDKDVAKKTETKTVPNDIGIKFAGRTISLENYTKMLTNTAEQTALVNGTINKGIQDQIYIYERVETIDSRTCKICRARDGEVRDVSKKGIPPALFHPGCRGYWKPQL